MTIIDIKRSKMKTLLLIIFIFCLTNTAIAQSNKLSDEERAKMKPFCQKWMLTILSIQGKSANIPAGEANYLTYNEDGSYTDSSRKFKVSHGTWTYDGKTQFVYTNETGGKGKAKVIKVTKDELILEMIAGNMAMIASYKKVE